jgi:hypothetical protein
MTRITAPTQTPAQLRCRLFMPALALLAALLPLVFAAGLRAADEVSAEDEDKEYAAEFLATRYELYEDAMRLAGTIADATTQSITKAKILAAQASKASAADRVRLYGEAEDQLREQTAPRAQLERARIQLTSVESKTLSKEDAEKVKGALDKLNNLRKEVDATYQKSNDAYGTEGAPSALYFTYIAAFYECMRAHYLLAKMEAPLSSARSKEVEEMQKVFLDMSFDRNYGWSREAFDSYILLGDGRVLNAEVEAAVSAYLALAQELYADAGDKTVPLVQDQCLRGYLKALETILNEQANNADALNKARKLVEQAYKEFPRAKEAASGRELLLYDAAALVKLGGNPDTALATLFKLVDDTDGGLRRKAARQLAELAGSPVLTNNQRLACVKKVTSVRELEVMLLAVNSMHALLAGIPDKRVTGMTDKQQYEAFAPLCYLQIGMIYESTRRFVDAAQVLREGADRFRYFRESHPDWEASTAPLPAHFFEGGAGGQPICDTTGQGGGYEMKLATQADAFDFPRKLAERALNNARYMVNKQYGDPANKDFAAFAKDYEDWYTANKFAGEEERFKIVKNAGFQRYNDGARDSARLLDSVRYLLSTPAADRSAVTTCFLAGSALLRIYRADQRPQVNAAEIAALFTGGYKLENVEFASQSARLETDFAKLPKELRDEAAADIAWLTTPANQTDRAQFFWRYCRYAFSRSLMLQLQGRTGWVEKLSASGQPVTLGNAVWAYGDALNITMLGKPENERQPDASMVQLARTLSQATFALRNPAVDLTDKDARTKKQDAMADEMRPASLSLLRSAWHTTSPHLLAGMANGADDEKVECTSLADSLLFALFKELIEANDATGAIEAFESYRARFGGAAATKDQKDRLVEMSQRLFKAMYDVERPRAFTMQDVAAGADELRLDLIKGATIEYFTREKRKDPISEAAWDAMPAVEKRKLTAEYIHNRVVQQVLPKLAEKIPNGGAELKAQEVALFEDEWKRLETSYSGIYVEAMRVGLKSAVGESSEPEAKPVLDEAMKMIATKTPDEVMAYIAAEAKKLLEDPNKSRVAAALNGVNYQLLSVQGDYEWGAGWAFKAELRDYLSRRADALRKAAIGPMNNYLSARAVQAQFSGKAELTDENDRISGSMYSGTGDWPRAYEAWMHYFKRQEAGFGDVSFIAADEARKTHDNDEVRANEVETRFQLALATFNIMLNESSKKKQADLAKDAFLQLRRCYNIMLWRDACAYRASKDGNWKSNLDRSELGKKIDFYYIPVMELYTKLCLWYADTGISPGQWPVKYYDQSLRNVTVEDCKKLDEKQRFMVLPETQKDFVRNAAAAQQSLTGYGSLAGGFFIQAFRDGMKKWAALTLRLADLEKKAGDKTAEDTAGVVLKFVGGTAEGRVGKVFDPPSKAFVGELVAIAAEARKRVSDEWLRKNYASALEGSKKPAAGSNPAGANSTPAGTPSKTAGAAEPAKTGTPEPAKTGG